MSTYRTDDEIKQEYSKAMGPTLGVEVHALENEVVWLHDKWREYGTLFAASEAVVDLLNETAGRFFGGLQETLWEDVLLHLCRVTDSKRNRTLSVRRLPYLIDHVVLKAEVSELVDVAVAKTAFARDWRNRHIAHRELLLALDRGVEPLAAASRLSVREALAALSAVFQPLHQLYLDGNISFDIHGGVGDAADLIRVLDSGRRADHAREERIRTGAWTQEDLDPRGPI